MINLVRKLKFFFRVSHIVLRVVKLINCLRTFKLFSVSRTMPREVQMINSARKLNIMNIILRVSQTVLRVA